MRSCLCSYATRRELVETGSPYAVGPGRVLTRQGGPFKVFTLFARAWREHGRRGKPPHSPAGGVPGRPRTILAELDAHPSGDGEGVRSFVNELAWREFYADVLWHHPGSAWRDLRGSLAGMRYDEGPEVDALVEAWMQGRTGFPFVDAGMRQLLGEGWMHNRVRMAPSYGTWRAPPFTNRGATTAATRTDTLSRSSITARNGVRPCVAMTCVNPLRDGTRRIDRYRALRPLRCRRIRCSPRTRRRPATGPPAVRPWPDTGPPGRRAPADRRQD